MAVAQGNLNKKVLTKKRLLLFEEMLNETGHGDGNLVKDLQGFKLTGPIPSVPGFRKKLTPSTLTEDDLRRNASRMRKATLMSTRGSGDKELDAAVVEATSKELKKGWLTGPFSETYLEPHACVSRRFGIKQKNKCRPIDNLRESNINSTTSAEDTIPVHTADVIGAGICVRMQAEKDEGLTRGCVLRTWDLAKAYKQLPLHSESLAYCYLSVYNPGVGRAEIYQQLVLPFGSRASVHSFVRVASAVWRIGVVSLMLHWNCYFDDYIVFERPALARHTDMCVTVLFTALRWDVAEDKDDRFSELGKVLGLEIDLSEYRLGLVRFQSTESRRSELYEDIKAHLAKGTLNPKEGARLRGRISSGGDVWLP